MTPYTDEERHMRKHGVTTVQRRVIRALNADPGFDGYRPQTLRALLRKGLVRQTGEGYEPTWLADNIGGEL
jgi:hypothetical protein